MFCETVAQATSSVAHKIITKETNFLVISMNDMFKIFINFIILSSNTK